MSTSGSKVASFIFAFIFTVATVYYVHYQNKNESLVTASSAVATMIAWYWVFSNLPSMFEKYSKPVDINDTKDRQHSMYSDMTPLTRPYGETRYDQLGLYKPHKELGRFN
jgi:hypothetical protein